MWESIKARFVPDWKDWHKWWSMRLAMVVSALVSGLTTYPDVAFGLYKELPPEIRSVMPVIGFVLFGLVFLSRVVTQKKLQGRNDGK